jgi:uncharacterized protein YbjT (DUF2867 family)
MRGLPGRGGGWLVVDVRDVAALHAALLTPGKGPRRYMAGGRRIGVAELASIIGAAANRSLRVYPVPDALLRNIGELADVVKRLKPLDTPVSAAAMQYFTQMPHSDDTPSTAELGIDYRDPRETLRDTVSGLQSVGRL